MTSPDRMVEAVMIPGWWTEHAVSERSAELRREAEYQRLVRWGRRGGKARRFGSVQWNGWVARIRTTRIRLQHRTAWPGPESLTQRADRP
jgi:hypothetical protein